MQEKIGEDIRKEMATIIRSEVYAGYGGELNYVHNAVDEIVKLFERKVMWEGEAEIKHSIHEGTWLLLKSNYTTLFVGKEGDIHHVVVEDIDESRT